MSSRPTHLRLSRPAYWAYYGLPLGLAAVGAAMVVVGILVIVAGHHLGGRLAGVLLVVLGVADVGILVPAGRKRLRRGRSEAVVLEGDGTYLRLHRSGKEDHQVALDRVRRVQVEYRVLTSPGRWAHASFYGEGGHRLATWDIWPLTGKRVGAWFRAQGLDVDVRVVGRHERVGQRAAGDRTGG